MQTACGGGFSSPSAGESPASGSDYQTPQGQAGDTLQGGTVTDFKLSCEEAQFITFLNIYRKQNSRSVLRVSKSATLAARWHAQNMIDLNYFSHTEPNGRDFSSRISSFGYGGWAENIAAGNSNAGNTFCQWKNSPGHNSNMLDSRHSATGIGRASGGGNYGTYWSSNFGGSVGDDLAEPLTSDPGCTIARILPGC